MISKSSETICLHFLKLPERGSATCVQYKQHGQWQSLNWIEYFDRIVLTASALINLGIQRGERVAIMSNTRLEWTLCDYGIMGLGAVTVPIYPSSTTDDIEYILNNSAAKVIFIENKSTLITLLELKPKLKNLEKIVCFNNEIVMTDKDCMTWGDFHARGSRNLKQNQDEFEKRCLKTEPSDLATLIYTSGTTGRPKGVMIHHEQIISEITEAFPFVGATHDDISLSFLPYAHVLGRIESWGHIFIGYQMAFAESLERIKQNLIEIKPTFLVAVPRIFEKIYSGIFAQLGNNPVKSSLFKWALQIGREAGAHRLKHEPIPLPLFAQLQVADKLVLSKVKEAFGGRLRFAMSGGAPIAQEIEEFFHSCGILILEGYGLTETTAAVFVNTPFDYKFGSVGKPIGDVQIKIAPDGEILLKSKKIMSGYYQDEAATKNVFEDGWFKTGDIGEILPSGDLKITDRKKDLIKTAGGKYVAPQKLENLLKTQPLISQAVIHGDNKKYIVALISLDFISLKKFCEESGLPSEDLSAATQNPKILEKIRRSVAEVNSQLASFETVKRFSIINRELTVDQGDLTPSLKVKRKVLEKKFATELEALYR
jgi:long-chain acyl-CoA synthetase